MRRPCRIPGCDRETGQPGGADELCPAHYQRRRSGVKGWDSKPLRVRGGTWKNSRGYVVAYMPDHPNATASGQIFQHVIVMSDHLGRPLAEHERVHHKNGCRDDNRIDNLELWSTWQPPGQRVEDKVQWARELLAFYTERELV